MSSQQYPKRPRQTPFEAADRVEPDYASIPPSMRKIPPGTALGLAITAGALAVIFIAAIVYRLTPQPKSPYLVGNPAPHGTTLRPPGQRATTEVVMPGTRPLEEPPLSIIANDSPEVSADQRLKEERRIEERNIAEQRQLEDKKRAIERQIEDKRADEKRRLEDKVLEDARIVDDKRLLDARIAEDKKIEDDRRLEAEREAAAAKLAAAQP